MKMNGGDRQEYFLFGSVFANAPVLFSVVGLFVVRNRCRPLKNEILIGIVHPFDLSRVNDKRTKIGEKKVGSGMQLAKRPDLSEFLPADMTCLTCRVLPNFSHEDLFRGLKQNSHPQKKNTKFLPAKNLFVTRHSCQYLDAECVSTLL